VNDADASDAPGERSERFEPDERVVEGIDHLQSAGREFVAAARSFLDAVEAVVEDRTRLSGLSESFTGFVGELIETARGGDRTPWGPAVNFDEPGPPDAAGTADQRSEPSPDSGGSQQDEVNPEPTQRSGRVRRIPVD